MIQQNRNTHKSRDKTDYSLYFRGLTGLRLVVASFGLLCGLTGIVAGIFEVFQGNISTNGYVISTIGPGYKMYKDFTYYAITIVPNFQLTGILAILTSISVIVWSTLFVHRRYGALVLLFLSIAQMLVGGGWVIDLGVIASVLATRMEKPHGWLDDNLADNVKLWLVRLFPYSVVVFALFAFCMLVLTIIGVNNVFLIRLLKPLAVTLFVPILLMIFGGISIEFYYNK